MLTHRLFIAEIMMLLNQAVEQRLIRCSSDLLYSRPEGFPQVPLIGVRSVDTGAGSRAAQTD